MGKQFIRPSWDEYFMEIAHVTKTRSNCIRDPKVGAVIVKDKRIIATGYNGTPHGIKNCFEGGCKRCNDREMNRVKAGEGKEKCICIHAEQNAIIQAAYHGISTKGAIMYATVTSCNNCAKMIINSGITCVYSDEEYTDEDGLRLLQEAKIEVKKIKRVGIVA